MRTGNAQALIPLSGDIDVQQIKGKIPRRLIVRYGDNPGDMAIAVTAPGGTSLNNLEIKPGTDFIRNRASGYLCLDRTA